MIYNLLITRKNFSSYVHLFKGPGAVLFFNVFVLEPVCCILPAAAAAIYNKLCCVFLFQFRNWRIG